MTATATPTQPFLATILDQHYADFKAGRPYDDGPRLVYADFLEEQGDPRAEFIRIGCELAKRIAKTVTTCDCGSRGGGGMYVRVLSCLKCKLRAREAGLLKRHGAEWLDCLPDGVRLDDGRPSASPTVRFVRGFPARFALSTRQAWGEACEWCNGTGRYWPPGREPGGPVGPYETCSCINGRVGAILPAILAATPVEEVRISGKRPSDSVGVHGWYRREMVDVPTTYSDVLPEVWDLIDMDDVVRTTIHGWKMFPTPAAAHAALSRAVIRHGLQGAG